MIFRAQNEVCVISLVQEKTKKEITIYWAKNDATNHPVFRTEIHQQSFADFRHSSRSH